MIERRDAFGHTIEKQSYEQDTLKARTQYTYDGAGRLLTTEQWDGTNWNEAMRMTRLPSMPVWLLVSTVILAGPAPAFSSFNLDYVVIGSIWVPSPGIKPPREVPRGR